MQASCTHVNGHVRVMWLLRGRVEENEFSFYLLQKIYQNVVLVPLHLRSSSAQSEIGRAVRLQYTRIIRGGLQNADASGAW